MKVINYFEVADKKHWLEEIKQSDWGGAIFLYELLTNNNFFNTLGASSKLLLLVNDKELISYCTYAEKDDIPNTELTPWIGFVYTFPKHRGHRYLNYLFNEIEKLAKHDNIPYVYLSTNHIGLYEKYGFIYFKEMIDIHNEASRIYVKEINDE